MTEGEQAATNPGQARDLGIPGFDLARVVGSGGYAVVYRARQAAFNRTVAIKVLSKVGLDAGAIRRFERERAALGGLSGHPNIVTVFESGLTADGVPYLVMEFLPFGSYAERVAEDGPLDWRDALVVGVRLAGALETAHSAGVLHRDVKPENVLLSNFGEPKLADFGIARVVEGPTTQSGRLELSVYHAPPEIIDGKAASPASDVYSLASTLFALLHGRPAFFDEEDDSVVRLLLRIGTATPPDLRPSGLPTQVCAVLERAMTKDPRHRFGSALALGEALQGAQADLGMTVTDLPLEGAAAPLPRPRAQAAATSTRQVIVEAPTGLLPPVNPRRSAVPRAVVVGVLAVVVAVAGYAGWRVIRPARTTKTETTTSKTPPQQSSVVATMAFPRGLTALGAGRYRTTAFLPGLTITLAGGWHLGSIEDPASLELARGDPATGPTLGFYRVDRVVDPQATPTGGSAAGRVLESRPTDLVAWLQGHPRLHVSRTARVVRGNTAGTELDLSVTTGYQERNCLLSCVLLFSSGSGYVAVFSGYPNSFYVFSQHGQQYVAAFSAPGAEFGAFAATVEQTLATMLTAPT